jgi:hypothetical protein
MHEHRKVALGECGLLAGDCVERDVRVVDDPFAVAPSNGGVIGDPF